MNSEYIPRQSHGTDVSLGSLPQSTSSSNYPPLSSSFSTMKIYWVTLHTYILFQLPSVRPFFYPSHGISRSHSRRANMSRQHSPIRRSYPRAAVMMSRPSSPIPRNIKDTVAALRAAVQEGLQAQQSRMDVDLPFAAQLGIEVTENTNTKKKRTATMEDVERSDRELARLFVEMFDVIGESVVVAFPTDEDAQKARKAWTAGAPYKGKVTSMNPKATKWPKMKIGSPETDAFLGFAAAEAKKKAKKKKGRGGEGKTSGGGGAGGAGSAGIDGAGDGSNASGVNKIAPPGTEVLLVVAPKQGELSVVEKLSAELGQGCLIVLLNARLHQVQFASDAQRDFFEKEFESMFHLRPVGSENDDFIYRTFPKDWTIARKPKIGPPKILKSQDKRPSDAEITGFVEGSGKPSGVFGNLF